MSGNEALPPGAHSHVFLGESHDRSERRTWAVIWLCGSMMLLEIVGGLLFGSIALVADGLHMSTHAGALLLAALAYTFARKHAENAHFTFGSGKFGDLAGFTSAVILAMIALLIGYESVSRIFAPVPIRFAEAIPIAFLGLAVNLTSAWLLSSGGRHHHGHGHSHPHDHGGGGDHGQVRRIPTRSGTHGLEVFEGAAPRFRLRGLDGPLPPADQVTVETERPGGARQSFTFESKDGYLESAEQIPEPHRFTAHVSIGDESLPVEFQEDGHDHETGSAHRDNNMRAAIIHVAADAAVSVLVIIGLVLARGFDWLWMDPLAGIVGACVIASWSYGLIRDTGAILLDMNPDKRLSASIRKLVESSGDELADLHLWRLGPGHLGAILSVNTGKSRGAEYYHDRLANFSSLSHVTVEIRQRQACVRSR
jgi:cation diffusion facilitator family transporter